MNARDYFPLGIASGSAFCNRTDETRLLVQNMLAGKHTLLIASRRYGKSSLALKAIAESKLPYVEVDFYMASNERVIEAYILKGVVELIGRALGPVEKLLTTIKKTVKNLKPKIDIGGDVFHLELQSDTEHDPATHIKEALLLLETLLAERKVQAVFLMDEFQIVGLIAQGCGIEAAIRHVAQKTKYLSIIFSGSHRQMLQTMFEDSTRPLYKLCWKLSLDRITTEHYHEHIQQAADCAWGQPVSEETLEAILILTARHPHYLNKLCDRLWALCDAQPPTPSDVSDAWYAILSEEKSDAVKEISLLSAGQKAVLGYIAKNPNMPISSRDALTEIALSGSTVMGALAGLIEKDVLEQDEGVYQIISPVIRHYALR